MHSFASERPRVSTFPVCVVSVNAVTITPYSGDICSRGRPVFTLS